MYAKKSEFIQLSLLKRVKIKFGKYLAKSFPLNRVRVWGLKLCGFEVGNKVYIGEDLIVASPISEKSCNLIIGNRVAIAPRVTIVLSSDANWSNLMDKIENIKSTIKLDDDCWIGVGSIILPGVKIGKMSIVAAGAVVTKDVQPFTIVAGIPAKKIKGII